MEKNKRLTEIASLSYQAASIALSAASTSSRKDEDHCLFLSSRMGTQIGNATTLLLLVAVRRTCNGATA
jgi:hypothetical protein